ncbi:SDR family oxidoreductase [Actinophytocola gossypii]|uniref:SDR family oxidoreductase n=1 Tax=Actinophytocola gossypii TaxID=2812003 RepID=A0ABT2J1M2_9PSEU|nr:SDR family oxidoreductase [Actinophytocola gossypii]MCT2581757.1 SDR family oxidoreductase [Actinophytocola gossypii]
MRIALTGATGFLGVRLVRELLSRHEVLTVLARTGSAGVVGRIEAALLAAGTPEPELRSRLRVVEVDLGAARLGLSAASFRKLADDLDLVLHCAGSIDLEGELAALRAVNVEGVRGVLELAAAGRRRPVPCHVSTAFVAGSRHSGVVHEDELDGSWGFENAYERSKYEAELLVRRWAARHRRPAVVLRPSILVDHRPPDPGLPAHPLQVMARLVTAFTPADRTVTVPGDPAAHLNLLPVDDAARAISALAVAEPSGGVDTYHVVHERDVPISELRHVLERVAGCRFTLDPRTPPGSAPTVPGFGPYLWHRRRYDDTRTRAVLTGPACAVPVDEDYLRIGVLPSRTPAVAR